MQRLNLPSFVLATAMFMGCGPSAEPLPPSEPTSTTSQSMSSIELVETALDAQLAATAAQAGVDVHALEIDEPVSGPVSVTEAAAVALEVASDTRLPWEYGATLTRAQVLEALGAPLVNDIERYINTGESYSAVVHGWSYPTAPDYCSTGHFYALVFNEARFVMTVEVNGGRDC